MSDSDMHPVVITHLCLTVAKLFFAVSCVCVCVQARSHSVVHLLVPFVYCSVGVALLISGSCSRCSKGLPLAMKAYKDNLPSLYMESRHKLQVRCFLMLSAIWCDQRRQTLRTNMH